MKNLKKIVAILAAASLVCSLTGCEIRREGLGNSTESTEIVVDENHPIIADDEGEDVSELFYPENVGFEIWHADNGDVYAFNASNNFYFKNGDTVNYGYFTFTTSESTLYSHLLNLEYDCSYGDGAAYNVNADGDSYILTSTETSEEIKITKGDGTEPLYEALGLKLYYVTEESFSDLEGILVMNAAPALYETNEDGTAGYTANDEESVQFTVTESSYIYMPSETDAEDSTSGCDVYQLSDIFAAYTGFYAIVIEEEGNVQNVQFCALAE